MRRPELSKHAAVRLQQRGIASPIVDLLLQFGATERSGRNTTKYYFDKPARRRVRACAGPLARLLEDHLDYYAVVGADGTVVTTAPRLTRIKH